MTQIKPEEKDEAPAAGYRIVLPPARHIPLSVNDVVEAMRHLIPHSQRAQFDEICQIVEGLALTEFSTIRRRTKKNFRFFSQAALKRDVPTRRGRGRAFRHLRKRAESSRSFFPSSAQLHTRCIITTDRLNDLAVKKEDTMDEMEVVFLSDFW